LLEYAILAGLIAIAAFMAFKGFGSNVSSVVGKQAETVTTINSTP
jgi:Flp pilus assembly pilin Flp